MWIIIRTKFSRNKVGALSSLSDAEERDDIGRNDSFVLLRVIFFVRYVRRIAVVLPLL